MYAIIDADGWHGDTVRVYSTHETLAQARQALGNGRSCRIVSGCSYPKGSKITRDGLRALLNRGDWREETRS